MRILRFDSIGGASGDMILAALTGLGVKPADLKARLASLKVESFDVEAVEHSDWGLKGTRLAVRIAPEHHPHRTLREIRDLIEGSALSDPEKRLSLLTFERLAVAEASVHGTTPDKIHFHEVGAMDSIVDIVGSCVALRMLGIDEVRVGALPMGTGTIEADHGVLPNPAPATVELLKGHPVAQTDEPFELVTPTGAALLMTWKAGLGAAGAGNAPVHACPVPEEDAGGVTRIAATSFGFGSRRLRGRANALRAMILESASSDLRPSTADACLVLECNLDDMTPELIGNLCGRLMDAGALDVFTTAVQMKKQRPGVLLTVLCRPADREALVELVFLDSTTFGIREHLTERVMLERRHEEARTPYGTVRVKVGSWKGRDVTRSPEYEDCVRCAREKDVPVKAVYAAALRQAPAAT